jgi:[acyl-carrier-protein] S-malonyltransferase
MLALLFPGQGAQFPGMGKDFYEAFKVVRETFEEADTYLKAPFSRLIFEGPAEELTLTKNSQVGIYVVGVALYRLLKEQFPGLKIHTCAGLSLGEYTALTAAGKLSFQEGLGLVQLRAAAMQRACEQVKGSMTVVLGLDEASVQEVLSQFNPPHPVWVANLNCPGQVVIAGGVEALSLVAEPLKQKGAKRCLGLDVSGAFHSGLMEPARQELAAKIATTTFHDTPCKMVMNTVGDYVLSIDKVQQGLIDQLTAPVRWESGILKMREAGMTQYLEVAPGKTLSGMNKRIGIVEPTYSLEKLSDLESLKEVLCRC